MAEGTAGKRARSGSAASGGATERGTARKGAAYALVKPGEAWAEDSGGAVAAVAAGVGVGRAFGEPGEGTAVVAEWALGTLPEVGLPTQHSGTGLLRPENWTAALRFFHESQRRSNPASLAAPRGLPGLASFGVADLQAAIGRGEAVAYSDKQRGVRGLAVFSPFGSPGVALLRYLDGPGDAAPRLLAFAVRTAAARGLTAVQVSLPAEQARGLQALLPDWTPERRQVVAAPPPADAAVERP